MTDNGARALAERLPAWLGLNVTDRQTTAAAILANGAVFLPDAAELDRLRRIEAVLERLMTAPTTDIRTSSAQALFDKAKRSGTQEITITAQSLRVLLPAIESEAVNLTLRAALAPEGSAGTASPVRAMYARLAAEYEARPPLPDRGGGVPGDLYEFPAAEGSAREMAAEPSRETVLAEAMAEWFGWDLDGEGDAEHVLAALAARGWRLVPSATERDRINEGYALSRSEPTIGDCSCVDAGASGHHVPCRLAAPSPEPLPREALDRASRLLDHLADYEACGYSHVGCIESLTHDPLAVEARLARAALSPDRPTPP